MFEGEKANLYKVRRKPSWLPIIKGLRGLSAL